MSDPRPPGPASRPAALAACVAAARLIGADPELALFGGGNTSVKVAAPGCTVLWVKGSGTDLAAAGEGDYAPLDLAAVRALLDVPDLDNRRMRERLRDCACAVDAPPPSIETLLHAMLPHPHVVHTHAAPVLALCNTVDGAAHVAAALGAQVLVVPYRHSGADLAAACRAAWLAAADAAPRGMVLMHHGLVTWGESAADACAATRALCARADAYLDRRGARRPPASDLADTALTASGCALVEALRAQAGAIAGQPLRAAVRSSRFLRAFAARPDVAGITAEGPATPGHALFTGRMPQVGRDCAAYAAAYRAYLGPGATGTGAPRVILDPDLGVLGLGSDMPSAARAATVFAHDAVVMARASALGGYRGAGDAWLRLAELDYGGASPAAIASAARLAAAAA
ncbi:MAG: class II aldolase/adducin family protein [Burkholderiales bacterium]|nr:class II aldolase/adducin family protein [Burkholderiales bacterium]